MREKPFSSSWKNMLDDDVAAVSANFWKMTRVVRQRVVEPPDTVPAAAERPLRRQVDLLRRAVLSDVAAQVAVTQVDRPQALRPVARGERQPFRAVVALVVLGA